LQRAWLAFWALGSVAWLCRARGAVAQEQEQPVPAPASAASVAALLFDIARIVDAEASGGWLVDEVEQRKIHGDVMESVCRATPAVRQAALAQLDAEAQRAGDPRALYERAHGQLTPEVEQALAVSRRQTALRDGVAAAPRQCPFWLRSDPEFRGVQSTRDRWILHFDTGGTAQLRHTVGTWAVGAGGFGRILGGYSFTRLSLLSGIEFGGGALIQPRTHPTQFAINYLPALPVIVRLQQQAWNFDLEAASVALFQAGNTSPSYGIRGGLTVGLCSLRLRGILPWLGLGVATEYHFENSARPSAWYIRGGLRVGGIWAP
jgi:hypothetical protein